MLPGHPSLARSVAWLAAAASLALAWPGPLGAQTVPAAAVLTLNDTQFRPGETIAMGLTVAVPPGNPVADLFVGAILPGGEQALFFSGTGQLAGPVSVLSPAQFTPFAAAAPGFSLVNLAFFQVTFPAAGVAPGTYQLFAALVRQGALADNRIDATDVLSLDLKPITFGASIQMSPNQGPSGTFVNVAGTGFTAGSTISFGAATVPGVFVSATDLGFVIPFAQAGASPVALAPGPQAVRVDGGPSQTFTVTSPPSNPSPAGAVTQAAVNSTGQTISQNRAAIDGALTSLKAQTASAEAGAYLDTMSGLVSDLQDVFTQDLASLGTSLDAATQAALDQALLNPAPPAPLPFLPIAAGPALAGDSFLDQRQALVSAGAQAARAAQVLAQICPLSSSSACSIAGAAFALTSTLADLIVGGSGNVVGLRLAASGGVTGSTPDRLTLRLRAADRPILSPFVIVQRQLNALDPVRLALEIDAARAQLNRALGSPGLGPATVARLARLAQSVDVLVTLAARLSANIPLQAPQELPVGFSRVGFRCPSDLFAALAIDAQGLVSVLQQAAFDVTRVCDFGLQPTFLTRGETTVFFEVAFAVARYGSVTMGPVRPVLAWGSLLLVVGLVLSQLTGRRGARPPPDRRPPSLN